MKPLLQVSHLRKEYDAIVAVRDVSFAVEQGICFGLLGPNGAGKTTTMEVIEGILPATGGKILYGGKPRDNQFPEEVGIQFPHTSLLNFLSVQETLATFHGLYQNPAELDTLIHQCDLQGLLKNKNNKLSGGQQQRLMLALALINRPNLIFLDEPSTGLDPQSRRNLWAIIEQIKEDGKTIILTTHSMEEAEYLCDIVAIMDHGRIIAMDSPDNLINTHCRTSSIVLPVSAIHFAPEKIPFPWKQHNSNIEIQVDNINEGLSRLMKLDADLTEMAVHSSNLEDVFLHLTGRQLRE